MGFKIFLDIQKVKLGKLLEGLGKIGDVIYVNNEIMVWLEEGKTRKSLVYLLKKLGVKEYFLREITEENVESEKDFAFAWSREHLNDTTIKEFEKKKQPELKQMLENIEKATELFNERIEEYKKLAKKEGVTDGQRKESEGSRDRTT